MDLKVNFLVKHEDEEDWLRAKSEIINKHGKLKGVMGKQIVQWIIKAIQLEKTKKKNKLRKKFQKDKIQRLAKLYLHLPEIITRNDFNRHVENLGIISSPTKRDYFSFFRGKGLLSEHHSNPVGYKGNSIGKSVWIKEDTTIAPSWFKETVKKLKEN